MQSSGSLRAELLRLLEEDKEFRNAAMGLLGIREILESIEENTRAIRSLQEQVRALQEQVAEHSKIIAEHTGAIRALQDQVRALQEQVRSLQEQVKALQEQVAEHSKIIAEHTGAIRDLQRTITALGARWGILAEEAFREAMEGIIARNFGGKVGRWATYDEEGIVHGHPSVVEVDLLLTDREHILVEIKSSVSQADVYELWRSAKLYEKKTGVKPRLMIASPFVEPKARDAAKELGIEVYSGI